MSKLKEGYKQTKVGVIPEEWEVVRLGDVAFRITQKNTKNEINKVLSNSAVNGIVMQNEYFDKDIANKNNLTGYYIVEHGDFVYNPRISKNAPAGPINRNLHLFSGVVSPLYTVFRVKSKNSINFLEYFFSSTLWLRYMQGIANYGVRHDRMNITNNDFMKMPIPLPPIEEQQKIAKILTTWDDAISRQEELIKAKEQLKKGLMQKLLSGEVRFGVGVLTPSIGAETSVSSNNITENGTKVPTPEWEEVKLGEVATFHKGKGISKKDISDTGIECIRYGELYTKYTELIKDIVSKTSIPKEELFLSRANDILIPASGETAIDLSTASCVLKKDIGLGGDINVIRTKNNGIFLAYYLNTIAKTKIASLAQGISVMHLYASQLKTLKIKFPPLKEQQKIAQILTTADKEIELLKNELEVLKEQKKGLMQKLLTGEVRVKI